MAERVYTARDDYGSDAWRWKKQAFEWLLGDWFIEAKKALIKNEMLGMFRRNLSIPDVDPNPELTASLVEALRAS